MRLYEWRSSGSVHWVPGPKAPFPASTMTLPEVEAPRGHRASPIVLHFKTDKHLLIRTDERALFLRTSGGKVVSTSARPEAVKLCMNKGYISTNGLQSCAHK